VVGGDELQLALTCPGPRTGVTTDMFFWRIPKKAKKWRDFGGHHSLVLPVPVVGQAVGRTVMLVLQYCMTAVLGVVVVKHLGDYYQYYQSSSMRQALEKNYCTSSATYYYQISFPWNL
jgi:hypothetical protein